MPHNEQPKHPCKTKQDITSCPPRSARASISSDSPAPLRSRQHDAPPQLRQRLENFWYHYKWHSLFGLFLTCVIVMLVHDFVTTPNYHMEIVLVSSSSYSDELLNDIAKKLKQYDSSQHQNQDDRIGVNHIRFDTHDLEQMDLDTATAQSIQLFGALSQKNPTLFLMDEMAAHHLAAEYDIAFADSLSPSQDQHAFVDVSHNTVLSELAMMRGEVLYLMLTPHQPAANQQWQEQYQQKLSFAQHLIQDVTVN